MTAQNENLTKGDRYEFRVEGHLRPDWSDWLEGLAVIPQENGETLLLGILPDQAALHGVLAKIRDLNLKLISVNHKDPEDLTKE
jgi:hypothetical protein